MEKVLFRGQVSFKLVMGCFMEQQPLAGPVIVLGRYLPLARDLAIDRRHPFAFSSVNECNRDFATIEVTQEHFIARSIDDECQFALRFFRASMLVYPVDNISSDVGRMYVLGEMPLPMSPASMALPGSVSYAHPAKVT